MATMIVTLNVASFERWKQDFESMTGARRSHGWLSHRVVRDATNPNVVTVISRVRDLDSAKRYGQSSELATAMQRSGVLEPPQIAFCNDDSELAY